MNDDLVEIEINLKQNVETEGEKAVKSIDNIASSSDKMKQELQETINIQKKVIGDLKKSLTEAESIFKKFNIGTNDPKIIANREKMSEVVRELKTELKGEEAALEELQKKTSTTAVKMKSLETRIRETREAMANLKLEGKQNTEEYRELEKRLGLLGTAYKEVYNTQKTLSSGSTQLEGVLSGLSALSGLMSAGAGAFGLMNSESENFAKIQTKVQSLMAITIGLQQISNTLHATSAFRITTVAKAKLFWASATNKLSVALGISNAAAKALMATLTLGLSVAITAVMVLVDKFISNQRKAAEEQKKITDAVSQAAGEQITSFEKLKKSYEALEGNVKDQKKFLEDNKDEFEKLGIAVGDVNSAENVFSDEGTKAFKTAVIERAKSLALMEIAAEKYKEIVAKELQVAEMPDIKTSSLGIKSENKKKARFKEQIAEDMAEWQKIIDQAFDHEMNAKTALAGAGISTPDPKKTDKNKDKIKSAAEKLARMSADFQGEIDTALVAAMKEGAAKKEAEIKAQYDRQKAIIAQKLTEIAELEKITGKPATEQRSLLDNWAAAEKTKFEATMQQLNDVAATEIGELWNDIDSRFKTRLDKELSDINKFYDDKIAGLKDVYKEESEIANASAEIEKKRQQDISLSLKNFELERIDFQTRIDLKRQQIRNRGILLETQKQENLLKIEKQGAEQRLQKLREMELAGADVAEDIAEVTVELEEMNAELEKMPVRKLQEALSNLEKISGSLAGLGGTLGDIFSSVGNAANDISAILDEEATGWDKAGIGISNAVNMVNMLTEAAKERKQVEQEYYQNQIALAHQYALVLNDQLRTQSELAGSGFVTNYAGKIKDGFNALTDATNGYQESLDKLAGGKAKTNLKNAVNWSNVGAGAGSGAAIGTAILPGIGTAIGAIAGGLIGLFGGKKKKETFGGLLEVFPELVDGAGNLNKELAQTLISTNQVDENTKQLLQNSLEWADAVEEARAQVKEIVVDLAGDLGNSMRDAIVGAWKAGEDASKSMFDAASASMEKFIEELLYSTIFSSVFDEFADRLAASMDPASGDYNLIDDYDWLVKQMESLYPGFLAQMDAIKAHAKDMGYDMWTDENAATRQASSKALAAASQDSINDLSGRITSVQGMVNDIRSYSAQSLDIEREKRAMTLIIQNQLATIADNTSYCRYLEGMSRTLDDINVKGVKLKS
jgi:hypothetical protein